ncbi:UNVERIFIED_CONTAM: hypothetical protein Sradi_5919500 [Sesamum radiatum]|uniref:Uncharacterized protein n=1 Tax=Sesamum radiatum TaxID=300843 RepID=A0AAW2KV06_SESRA
MAKNTICRRKRCSIAYHKVADASGLQVSETLESEHTRTRLEVKRKIMQLRINPVVQGISCSSRKHGDQVIKT